MIFSVVCTDIGLVVIFCNKFATLLCTQKIITLLCVGCKTIDALKQYLGKSYSKIQVFQLKTKQEVSLLQLNCYLGKI